jgi:hypothetical protein
MDISVSQDQHSAGAMTEKKVQAVAVQENADICTPDVDCLEKGRRPKDPCSLQPPGLLPKTCLEFIPKWQSIRT